MTTDIESAAASEIFGPARERFVTEEWHERDLAAIFRPTWNLAAHSSELTEPGAYVTFALGKEEVFIVRGQDRELHAYHNFCRHRGHRLCTSKQGKLRRRIVCPYHGWSYSADDGACRSAIKMHSSFDRSQWGLLPAWVEEFDGLVFVCLDDAKPASLRTAFRNTGYGGYDLGRMKVAERRTYSVAANWKIVVENNLECYHCALNHPELCTNYDPWADYDAFTDPRYTGEVMARTVEGVSFTMHGKEVCKRPVERTTAGPPDACEIWWNPSTAVVILRDYAWLFSLTPVAPGVTVKTDYYLVHEDAQPGVDYDLEELTGFLAITTEQQDKLLCEEIQLGMEMPRYTPGPLNQHYQTGQIRFYDWYESQLQAHESALG